MAFLALCAAKLVTLIAVTAATSLASLATLVAPAVGVLTDQLTSPARCHTIVLPADLAQGADLLPASVPVVHRGAERAIVFAISPTTDAASPRAVSFKCSIVSDAECMRREADPST